MKYIWVARYASKQRVMVNAKKILYVAPFVESSSAICGASIVFSDKTFIRTEESVEQIYELINPEKSYDNVNQ